MEREKETGKGEDMGAARMKEKGNSVRKRIQENEVPPQNIYTPRPCSVARTVLGKESPMYTQ